MWVPRAIYSLRMSFWIVPSSRPGSTPCFFATAMYNASRIDAVELIVIDVLTLSSGMAVEQYLHVREIADRHARPPHLADGQRVVRVVARLRRQVEGDAQPGLAFVKQVAIAPVRLLRRREPRVLSHRPDAAPVHVGLHAAGVGVFARIPQVSPVVEAGHVLRYVDRLDLQPRVSLEAVAQLSEPLLHRPESLVLPLALRLTWHASDPGVCRGGSAPFAGVQGGGPYQLRAGGSEQKKGSLQPFPPYALVIVTSTPSFAPSAVRYSSIVADWPVMKRETNRKTGL